eukprot:g208.t1
MDRRAIERIRKNRKYRELIRNWRLFAFSNDGGNNSGASARHSKERSTSGGVVTGPQEQLLPTSIDGPPLGAFPGAGAGAPLANQPSAAQPSANVVNLSSGTGTTGNSHQERASTTSNSSIIHEVILRSQPLLTQDDGLDPMDRASGSAPPGHALLASSTGHSQRTSEVSASSGRDRLSFLMQHVAGRAGWRSSARGSGPLFDVPLAVPKARNSMPVTSGVRAHEETDSVFDEETSVSSEKLDASTFDLLSQMTADVDVTQGAGRELAALDIVGDLRPETGGAAAAAPSASATRSSGRSSRGQHSGATVGLRHMAGPFGNNTVGAAECVLEVVDDVEQVDGSTGTTSRKVRGVKILTPSQKKKALFKRLLRRFAKHQLLKQLPAVDRQLTT